MFANRTVSLHALYRGYSSLRPNPVEVTELLGRYASAPPRPLNLATLLSFGRPLTPNSLLSSVAYVLSEIPRRLATRVRSLEALPFIVGTNPYIAKTLAAYRESFYWLATYPTVANLEKNAQFVAQLERLVQNHTHDIPTMARGFQECANYISSSQISEFLDSAIRSRISVRLIAEQHIALSQAIITQGATRTQVGVVDVRCSPSKMVSVCGSFVHQLCEATLGLSPQIVVEGQLDASFAYVPVHLEYILTEILKNAFRATVEHQRQIDAYSPLPLVIVTLSPPKKQEGHGPSYFSIRIRDQGGGVSKGDISKVFTYAYTTARKPLAAVSKEDPGHGLFTNIVEQGLQTGLGRIAGLGYGLPMSKLYTSYFGGSLSFNSLEGWGSDILLKLRCLDEAEDSPI